MKFKKFHFQDYSKDVLWEEEIFFKHIFFHRLKQPRIFVEEGVPL
jgi:hypothetical protein